MNAQYRNRCYRKLFQDICMTIHLAMQNTCEQGQLKSRKNTVTVRFTFDTSISIAGESMINASKIKGRNQKHASRTPPRGLLSISHHAAKSQRLSSTSTTRLGTLKRIDKAASLDCECIANLACLWCNVNEAELNETRFAPFTWTQGYAFSNITVTLPNFCLHSNFSSCLMDTWSVFHNTPMRSSRRILSWEILVLYG